MRRQIFNQMYRRIMLAIVLTALALSSLPSMAVHAAAGDGRIFGQLLDGTNHNVPLAKQTITLQMAQNNSGHDLTTSITDARGNFSFPNLATDKTISYAVYMSYQGAQYVSNVVSLDSKPVQQVNLTVYQATSSTANIAIVQATVLLHEPDAKNGLFTVSEIFEFKNLDSHTFVGSLDTSKGRPDALFFSLPHSVRNITLSKGFDGYKAIQVDSGFATDVALLPGNTEIAFAFDVPYTTSSYDFGYTAMNPTVSLSFLVPPDVHVNSGALTSQGVITADQHPYRLLKTDGLLPNQAVHLGLEGLPVAAAPTPLNLGNIWLIVGVLLMLSVLMITWFIYRNRRQRGPKSRQGQGLASKETEVTATKKRSTSKDQREVLLQELLDLDQAFETGKLSKAAYRERRAKTKARLRTLMSEREALRR